MSVFSVLFCICGHAVTRFSVLSLLFPGPCEDRKPLTFPDLEVLAALVPPRRDSSYVMWSIFISLLFLLKSVCIVANFCMLL